MFEKVGNTYFGPLFGTKIQLLKISIQFSLFTFILIKHIFYSVDIQKTSFRSNYIQEGFFDSAIFIDSSDLTFRKHYKFDIKKHVLIKHLTN